jgi:hypothetical protein
MRHAAYSLAAAALMGMSSAALAQTGPMSEVIGQPIQATTNGVTNTLYFDPDGTVRIITPNGNTVSGTWAMQNGNLCISKGGATECWPYNAPFQPQQPQTMTSSCNAVSTWLAQNTNGPANRAKGERGQ